MLSIIIPTYNRTDLIKYTLDSLNSKYHQGVEVEVIVVDDGSTDGTKQIINTSYPYVRIFTNTGKGAAAARNTGLAAAKGKYILYLDSDDLVGEDFFKQKLALLEQRPDIDACYGSYDFFESNGIFKNEAVIFKHKYPLIASPELIKDHLINYLSGNFIPPLAIIWRRSFLAALGGHDPSFLVNQDVELFIRALFKGLKIIGIEDSTKVYVREHSLDSRVGDPGNAKKKWEQILAHRKKVFKELRAGGYDDAGFFAALSSYLFGYWKLLRHTDTEMAAEYLAAAKEFHGPVTIKGSALYRSLGYFLGPVSAVKIKYFFLKRD